MDAAKESEVGLRAIDKIIVEGILITSTYIEDQECKEWVTNYVKNEIPKHRDKNMAARANDLLKE